MEIDVGTGHDFTRTELSRVSGGHCLKIHYHDHNFPDVSFRGHVRMGRETFNQFLHVVGSRIQRQDTRFRDCTKVEKVLALTLYRIAQRGS